MRLAVLHLWIRHGYLSTPTQGVSHIIKWVGLLSPIRHAKVPHGLSRRIIRARSAKRQSDLESLEKRVCRTFPSMIGSSHSGYKPIKIDATRRE